MAKKKYKETVASVVAVAVGAFLLGRAMRRRDELSGLEDEDFNKEYSTEQSVINNLKKLVAAKRKIYVYYNWENNKYTVSTTELEEGNQFYQIQFVRHGSHVMNTLVPRHVIAWRQKKEITLYR